MAYSTRRLQRTFAPCLIVIVLFAVSSTVAQATDRHSGGTLADVASIKKAIAARIRYPITDWFIAIQGSHAVVQYAEGPAAGGEAGLVRRHNRWIVTCTGNGKFPLTECAMPASVFASLSAQTNRLMSRP
jgi:invasion protein IalB